MSFICVIILRGAYPILNRDLLFAAAICHDIGKTRELSSFPDNDYTDEGQLIGHIVIGVEMVDEAIRSIPDFPERLANELKHCIIAHHGELEYGSPKKPALAEALALNLADNADAKMQTLTEIFKGKTGTEWLGYNRLFESNLRRTSEREMQKNDTAVIEITDIGTDGAGIGKADGYTLFVKDAVIGDIAEVKVMKAKKNYGYARLMKVVEPSKYRVQPRCAFARRCGGCQIQEMSYDRQLAFKEQKVRGNLERIGGFSPEFIDGIMDPVAGMEHPFGYRNKAQFPFGTDKEGNPVVGFYAGRTHDIIANTDCALGVPVNQEILEIILKFMKENSIPAYNEKTGQGAGPPCADTIWLFNERDHGMSCHKRNKDPSCRKTDRSSDGTPRNNKHYNKREYTQG